MALNPTVMQAVEQLGYRVTVADVAARSGLNIEIANQGLLALACEAGGHMQVANSGDIVYLFPRNFRDILRKKYLWLQLQQWWKKIWKVLFYLIRISFGIFLIVSIALIYITIFIIIISGSSDRDSSDRFGDGGAGFFYFPDLFWYLSPNYDSYYQQRRQEQTKSDLNFFEAVFSFLFGDGNPNANLEERRWREIAAVIRNNQGAVVAEQIAPYLDDIGEKYQQEYEDYMLPVLTRFNGKPQVSPEGQIIYHFPELQLSVVKNRSRSIPPYLQEFPWRFSAASSGQILLSAGLGAVNFIGALILGSLLKTGTAAATLGGLVGFVQGFYWVLLGYGTGFLAIPLVRYFWIQHCNRKIAERNRQRQARAMVLATPDTQLQQKIAYARQFAAEKVIGQEDLVYSTETDLLVQEFENKAQIDAEWQKRLEQEGNKD